MLKGILLAFLPVLKNKNASWELLYIKIMNVKVVKGTALDPGQSWAACALFMHTDKYLWKKKIPCKTLGHFTSKESFNYAVSIVIPFLYLLCIKYVFCIFLFYR